MQVKVVDRRGAHTGRAVDIEKAILHRWALRLGNGIFKIAMENKQKNSWRKFPWEESCRRWSITELHQLRSHHLPGEPPELPVCVLPVQREAEWVCSVNDTVLRGKIISLLVLLVSSFQLQRIKAIVPESRMGLVWWIFIHSLPPISLLFHHGKSRSG